MVSVCKNCGQPVSDKYCAHCGQKSSTQRFTLRHLLHEFLHGFYHVDHGLLFTAKELAVRPGRTIKNYLKGQRIRYFNPFTFLLMWGGINALLLKKLHWQSFFIDLGMLDKNAVNQEIWNSSVEHFTVRLLLAIPVYSLVTFCFYFKKRYTFTEHLVTNTFVRGELSFFMILIEPLLFISAQQTFLMIAKFLLLMVLIVYNGWSYSGVFSSQHRKTDILKGIFISLIAVSLELLLLNLLISKRVAAQLF